MTESILLAATITGIVDVAQQVGHVEVTGPDASLGVDDQDGDVGLGDRLARLLLDLAGEVIALVEVDAAGVDQRQRATVPLGLQLLAVARDTGASRAQPPHATR